MTKGKVDTEGKGATVIRAGGQKIKKKKKIFKQ